MAVPDYAPLLPRLATLAEADPGWEICGFLTIGPRGDLRVCPVRNVVGEEPWSEGVPGDPRIAYLADPVALLALSRRLRTEGGRIAAVYHSHVDGPAALSATDLDRALCDGAPLLPGVDQIVIGMRSGKVTEIQVFQWKEGAFRPGGRASRDAGRTPSG